MPKPYLKLIIDTREQKRLEFKEGVFDEVIVDTLNYADYACELDGKRIPIYFEKKMLGDVFGTMTHGNERFKRMLERAKEDKVDVVLVIEGSMEDVFEGYKHSFVSGAQILRTIFSFWVRYGLVPVFCPNRRSASKFIEETYLACSRNYKTTEDT